MPQTLLGGQPPTDQEAASFREAIQAVGYETSAGGGVVKTIVTLTKAEYDALTPDPETLYFIREA